MNKANQAKKILLAVLGVALAAALFFIVRFYTRVKAQPMRAFEAPSAAPETPAATPSAAPHSPTPEAALETPAAPSPQEALQAAADAEFMRERVNILLLGWDQSPEREKEDSALYRDESNNYRSDVMMLLSVDFAGRRAELISIPRDTMASIYETEGRWKINAAFAKGGSAAGDGFHYAIKTVENLLCLPIGYYAGVDMQGVKTVVDAMGGVDYEVDVHIRINGRELNEGMQHLDGQQVLDYCRARKRITGTNSAGANSDVGRADRQQRILFAILDQLQRRGQLVNIPRIYDSVKGYVHTNLNAEQIAALALFAQELDMQTQLSRYTLPGEMITKTPFSGASFYVLDTPELQALMQKLYGVRIPVDHRFGLAYVQAEKDAQLGREYAAAARYLSGLCGVDLDAVRAEWEGGRRGMLQTEFVELDELVKKVETSCTRTPWAEVEGYDDELPVRAAEEDALILADIEVLRERLLSLCVSRGLRAEQLEEESVPEEFTELLRAAYLAMDGR